jgi:tetratricopeptide (TPR) repeat protein
MLAGDDHVAFATSEPVRMVRKRMVEKAALAYEAASRARPDAAEPHLRAAAVLDAFFLECSRDDAPLCEPTIDRDVAERVIAHWDAFTRLAPLDPRGTDEILLDRALLHTKLATPDDWVAATHDYEELLSRMRDDARTDVVGTSRGRRSLVTGNLAETYMMLGDLDRAIETYRVSLRYDPDTSRMFGLAVALDRDEQRTEAWHVLRQQGGDALADLIADIDRHIVFFVPEGEAEYYLALGAEFSGDAVGAIEHYEAFIRSGAHPRYQQRARDNIARLKARPVRRSVADRPLDWAR